MDGCLNLVFVAYSFAFFLRLQTERIHRLVCQPLMDLNVMCCLSVVCKRRCLVLQEVAYCIAKGRLS